MSLSVLGSCIEPPAVVFAETGWIIASCRFLVVGCLGRIALTPCRESKNAVSQHCTLSTTLLHRICNPRFKMAERLLSAPRCAPKYEQGLAMTPITSYCASCGATYR